MAQEELNLFKLASGLVTKPSAGSAEIVWSKHAETAIRSCLTDDRPDYLRGEPSTPNFAGLHNSAGKNSTLQVCRVNPGVHSRLNPRRDRYGPHMSAFADEVRQNPVILPELEVFNLHRHNLGPAKTTTHQHRQHSFVTNGAELLP